MTIGANLKVRLQSDHERVGVTTVTPTRFVYPGPRNVIEATGSLVTPPSARVDHADKVFPYNCHAKALLATRLSHR